MLKEDKRKTRFCIIHCFFFLNVETKIGKRKENHVNSRLIVRSLGHKIVH